jgi:hypothetical protein
MVEKWSAKITQLHPWERDSPYSKPHLRLREPTKSFFWLEDNELKKMPVDARDYGLTEFELCAVWHFSSSRNLAASSYCSLSTASQAFL